MRAKAAGVEVSVAFFWRCMFGGHFHAIPPMLRYQGFAQAIRWNAHSIENSKL
jgi:hypothetical protein